VEGEEGGGAVGGWGEGAGNPLESWELGPGPVAGRFGPGARFRFVARGWGWGDRGVGVCRGARHVCFQELPLIKTHWVVLQGFGVMVRRGMWARYTLKRMIAQSNVIGKVNRGGSLNRAV